jgi:hypothetical protein
MVPRDTAASGCIRPLDAGCMLDRMVVRVHVDPPKELGQFLTRYDEAVRSLTLRLRAIVLQELAPCHEYIFEMRSKVVLLYGASEQVISDGICSIGVFRRHVTLTFVEGVDLQDPDHLLLGAGKTMRHIRIVSSAELGRGELREFLVQARTLAGLPPRRGDARAEVMTRVKPRSARRPAASSMFKR